MIMHKNIQKNCPIYIQIVISMILSCMRESDLLEYLREKLTNLLAGLSAMCYLRDNPATILSSSGAQKLVMRTYLSTSTIELRDWSEFWAAELYIKLRENVNIIYIQTVLIKWIERYNYEHFKSCLGDCILTTFTSVISCSYILRFGGQPFNIQGG